MTNMEQIQHMTTDELSAFLFKITVTGAVFCNGNCVRPRFMSCRACLTHWLCEEGDKKL